MIENKNLKKSDRDNFIHPMTDLEKFERGELPQKIMHSGYGSYIKDIENNEYLDAFAGLYCVNIGYGRTEVADAISKQAHKLSYYHSYLGHSTEASIELSEMVLDRSPKNMSKIFFGLTGSDANELNVKLVWYYNNIIGKTKKKKIISRMRGYHGAGILSGSLTGLKNYHVNFDLPIDRVLHTEQAFYYHRTNLDQTEEQYSKYCSDQLEKLILSQEPDTIAAFIAEPIMGNGGIVPPPNKYWEEISVILKRYDIMLIADEVVTGFGRLGSMFGSDHYNIVPDFITIAKGLTSAYAPLSGSIISNKVWDVIKKGTDQYASLNHGSTYSGHPISCAAGVANLKLLDKLDLINNASETGKYLNERLLGALSSHEKIGDVRGAGMLAAVEIVKEKKERKFYSKQGLIAADIIKAMKNYGVLARAMPEGDIIGFAPPLCASKKEIDKIVDVTKKAIIEVIS
ncbi:MAG: aminotransferase class III-fold pyridoxal phosphate-dependent enzyme [Alphaproteobacteria bacterium]|jgi:L-2,4-diaminobutyrate transaminase